MFNQIQNNTYFRIILIFVITGLWDVLLRFFSLRKIKLLGIEDWKWVSTLKPYFEHHTLLSAALIAGFVGAITYIVLLSFNINTNRYNNIEYSLLVFIISALIGIPMRYSGLFPILKKYYYDKLPIVTFFSDGLSGIVVMITLFFLQNFFI